MTRAPQHVVFYFNGTFMGRTNGAHARATAFLNFLRRHFETVSVYSFRDHPTCPWTRDLVAKFADEFPGVALVLEERTAMLVLMTRLKNLLVALMPSRARSIVQLRLPGAAPAYEFLLREHRQATIVVNYADGVTQLNGVPEGRYVVETHDIMFVNYRLQSHRAATSLRPLLKYRIEIALLDTARSTIAISPTETNVFRLLVDHTEVLYVPDFGSGETRSLPEGASDEEFRFDLLFVGSENVLNVEGLLLFLAEHGTWLAGYRIAVCGKVCEVEAVVAAASCLPNVSLLGFLDDLEPVYRATKAAVSPVSGTGLKIKIVDAFARGKPVFASQSSMAGLPPGHENCVFPIASESVKRLIHDDEVRRAAERSCRDYYAGFSRHGDRDRLLQVLGEAGRVTAAAPRMAASLGTDMALAPLPAMPSSNLVEGQ